MEKQITEKQKQQLREDGVLIDDLLFVERKIKELGLGENLANQCGNLVKPLIRKESAERTGVQRMVNEVFKRIRETIKIDIVEQPFMKIMEDYSESKFRIWKEEFIKELKDCDESKFVERGQFNKEYFKKFIEELVEKKGEEDDR